MDNATFNQVVSELFKACSSTLARTEKGYTVDKKDDRLGFFKRAAALDGETPEQALKGMWKKHLISVLELIKWTETEPNRLDQDIVTEKIHDSINYHALLYALLVERLKERDGEPGEPITLEPFIDPIPDPYDFPGGPKEYPPLKTHGVEQCIPVTCNPNDAVSLDPPTTILSFPSIDDHLNSIEGKPNLAKKEEPVPWVQRVQSKLAKHAHRPGKVD